MMPSALGNFHRKRYTILLVFIDWGLDTERMFVYNIEQMS
jgi:hypothetical protein